MRAAAVSASEDAWSPMLLAPTGSDSATVERFDHFAVPCLIVPTLARITPTAVELLAARVEILERQLAESEHLRAVTRATLASAPAFRSAWDDEQPDAEL